MFGLQHEVILEKKTAKSSLFLVPEQELRIGKSSQTGFAG